MVWAGMVKELVTVVHTVVDVDQLELAIRTAWQHCTTKEKLAEYGRVIRHNMEQCVEHNGGNGYEQ